MVYGPVLNNARPRPKPKFKPGKIVQAVRTHVRLPVILTDTLLRDLLFDEGALDGRAFALTDGVRGFIVFYDKQNDEFWYERLTKAI